MGDAIYGCTLNLIIFIIFDIFLIWLAKPDKRRMKAGFLAGIIMSITTFFLEAYIYYIGLGGYISDYAIMSIPVVVPFFYIFVGFGFPIFYEEFTRRVNAKVKIKHFNKTFFLVYILIVATGSLGGDILLATPENCSGSQYWNLMWTWFIWIFLWIVDFSAYLYFKKRVAPKPL
jgi:hypothetical protein